MPRLDFRYVHSHGSKVGGISVPVVLRSSGKNVHLFASIDTGASNCLFEREHGELLNLDIEAGDAKTFSTANGRIETFGHVVSLEVFELAFESMVYFLADERIDRNLLGRGGWLGRIRFGLVD
jgi:predicted aspartyl protease